MNLHQTLAVISFNIWPKKYNNSQDTFSPPQTWRCRQRAWLPNAPSDAATKLENPETIKSLWAPIPSGSNSKTVLLNVFWRLLLKIKYTIIHTSAFKKMIKFVLLHWGRNGLWIHLDRNLDRFLWAVRCFQTRLSNGFPLHMFHVCFSRPGNTSWTAGWSPVSTPKSSWADGW